MKKIILPAFALIATITACEKKSNTYDPNAIPFFAPLTPPNAGEGFQKHVETFPIKANFEREIYIRKALGNTEEVYMNGFEMKGRPGTHHMIAYQFLDDKNLPPMNVMYDQNQPNNTLDLRSAAVAVPLFQSPAAYYNFELPKGYAVRVPANASFNMNSHYFNKTDKTRFGELYVNFKTTPKANVQQVLDVMYYQPDKLNIAPNKTSTVETTYTMDKKTIIPLMISHYHKLGKKFDVYVVGGANDGKLVYTSSDYENPVIETFATPLVLEAGQGLRTVVTYDNTTNRTIEFGVTSEDEMNILIAFQHN